MKLDRNYKASEVKEVFFDLKKDSIEQFKTVMIYNFNEKGYLDKVSEKRDNNNVIIINNHYLEFDQKKNPIKSLKIQNGNTENYLTLRVFEYY